MKRTLLALAGAFLFAGSALAGPQYVDKSGFALSGYDAVAYFSLKQGAVGSAQPKAVPGKSPLLQTTTERSGHFLRKLIETSS